MGCCTLYMVERQRRNPGEEWGSCDRGMFAQEEWPVDNTWDSEISCKTTREESRLIVLNVCRGFFFPELKRCFERFYPVHQGMIYMNCHCYMTLESPPKTVLRKFHTLILWDVTGYRKIQLNFFWEYTQCLLWLWPLFPYLWGHWHDLCTSGFDGAREHLAEVPFYGTTSGVMGFIQGAFPAKHDSWFAAPIDQTGCLQCWQCLLMISDHVSAPFRF